MELNKDKILESKRGSCNNVWIYFEICNAFNIAQRWRKQWRGQVSTSNAWILETLQDSDDTGMKDNNESFSISIDNKEEKGNVSKASTLTGLKKGEENGTRKAKTLMKKKQWVIF